MQSHNMKIPRRALKWMALVGELLIMVAFGTAYTFGNMTPYFTSYMRESLDDPSIDYSITSWVNTLAAIGHSVAMPFSGYIEDRLGCRLTALIGSVIFCVSVFLSAFALDWSFYAFATFYGFLFGVGTGIAYPICIACSIRWFPTKKGMISGITLLGYGLSSFVFNIVQTAIINPNNLDPDVSNPNNLANDQYFSQSEVLERVPLCFMILAGIYAVMQLVGVILINSPDQETSLSVDLPGLPSSSDVCKLKNVTITQQSSEFSGNSALATAAESDNKTHSVGVKNADNTNQHDVTPSEMLRSKHFYMLYVIFAANSLTVNFIATLYKAFGQTFISNDFYLTLVGSLSSVFNAAGRIFWGFVADRVSNKFALFTICCLGAALLFSLIACTAIPAALYLVWICLIFFVFSGQFAVCPATIAKLYGDKYFPTNYGLLFTSGILGSVMAATLATVLLQTIGWFGLFCICGGFYVVGAVTAFMFHAKNSDGREI